MIIPNNNREHEESGHFDTTQFTIKASKEAFRALSDRLYTDKPMAVVREIYCNALDIHVITNTQREDIEIHLPTYEESFFSVKDYGTGLSEADIRGIYSTFFATTKNTNNIEVGGMGVGAKSLLSYTDSFTVSSRYNGILFVYNVFINGKGIPSVAKLSEEPTSEPNGLEVSCAVALGDINRFAEAARKFFSRIPNLPKFNIEFAPDKINYSAEGEGWKARSTNYGEQSGLVAVVGPVAYPFTLPSGSVSSELHYLLSANLDLFFSIGEVDVAMSRESLSLDENTIDKIVAKLRQIHESSIAKLEEELDKCPNIFRARKRLHEMSKQHGSLYYGAKAADINYKGEPLKTLGTPVITKTVIAGMESNSGATLISNVYRRGRDVVNTEEISSLQADKEYVFFVGPKSVSRAKLRAWINDNDKNLVLFITDKTASEALSEFGLDGERTISAADFPKAVGRSFGYTDKGLAPCLILTSDCLNSHSWSLPEEAPSPDEEVVYIKMTRYGVNDGLSPYNTWRKLTAIKECGGPEIELHGCRSKLLKEASTNANWIHFDAWFKRECEKLRDKVGGLAELYEAHNEYKGYRVEERVSKLPAKHIIKKVTDKKCEKYQFHSVVAAHLNMVTNGLKKTVAAKYPLFKMISNNYHEVTDEQVADYISLCESALDNSEKTDKVAL
jgi:hypothetical protein